MPLAERHPLYYFHGFASAIPRDFADSPKITEVAAWAGRRGRDFRPRNIDYRKAPAHARTLLDEVDGSVRDVVFCGASMGGWFARIMQLLLARERPGLPIAAVVFNPAFNLAEFSHLLEGPQLNYVTQQSFDWTPTHSSRLVELETAVEYRADLPFWVYVDRDDEVIDSALSERFHRDFARLRVFDGGSHTFEHTREALKDFDDACWPPPSQC
ncbi:MAG: YqiA/YcfP family alpha/beta fold hydrolase [Xanthomonadales bacterium]